MSAPQPDRTCSTCGASCDESSLEGLCPQCRALIEAQFPSPREEEAPHGVPASAGQTAAESSDSQTSKAPQQALPSPGGEGQGEGGILRRGQTDPSTAKSTVREQEHTEPIFSEPHAERIGHYKLLQKIGEGGFGVVYMADQEQPVKRRVALKVIKLGMDTRQVVARFEAERQALALMDHPNIAKVFDGGATDSGRPYFVMELVKGIKITQYCDQNHVGLKERLDLFLQVCQAIQHAHQKGIIHRDIKPSNIMVTMNDGKPVPKVIDFGIAKATEQRLTDKTLFTAYEQFMGTPAYMSPEQAEMTGLDIDTRSDIYSLGVLLYELLTGRTPFDNETLLQRGVEEARRAIREVEPPRPSTKLTELIAADVRRLTSKPETPATEIDIASLRRLLQERKERIHFVRGDLDWVVMKCLEKDRTRRYETTNGLAMDIKRYLNQEPIIARPPSNIYRFQKLVRRNKAAVAAAAMIVTALLVGLGAATWSLIRERAARVDAEEARLREHSERGRAERSAHEAGVNLSLAKANLYVADMNVVAQALDDGNTARATQLLQAHRRDSPNLMGFEWRLYWRQCRSTPHFVLRGHDGVVTMLAFSPDGSLLASLDDLRNLKLWNVTNRQALLTVTNITTLGGFRLDGRAVVVGLPDRSVGCFDIPTRNLSTRLPQSGRLLSLLADGQTVATAGTNFIKLWNVASGKETAHLSAHEIPLPRWPATAGLSLAVSSDGNKLLYEPSANSAGSEYLLLWNLQTRQQLRQFPWGRNLLAVEFFAGDSKVAVGAVDGSVCLIDCNSDSQPVCWQAHGGSVRAFAFPPNEETVITAGSDQVIRLWDLRTQRKLNEFYGHEDKVQSLAVSADGCRLASGAWDNTVRIWDLKNRGGTDVLAGGSRSLGNSICFSHDGKVVAIRFEGPLVKILDSVTLRELDTIPGARTPVKFSSDDRSLICTTTNAVIVWDVLAHAVKKRVESPDPNARLSMAEVSRDDRFIAWAFDSVVILSDLSTGVSLQLPEVSESPVQGLTFSPNSRLLFSVRRGGTLHTYHINEQMIHAPLLAHPRGMIGALAISPDGKLIATAGFDRTVKLWDPVSMRLLHTLTAHRQAVYSVAFSPDSRTLASVASDNVIILWNLSVYQQVGALKPHGDATAAIAHRAIQLVSRDAQVAFSPDGNVLGALQMDGQIKFWRGASWQEIEATAKDERP